MEKEISKDKAISVKTEKVTISTDKTEYQEGEKVKIIIENNLDKSIFLAENSCDKALVPYPMLISYVANQRVGSVPLYPHDSSCEMKYIFCEELKNTKESELLLQRRYQNAPLLPGKHKIRFLFGESCGDYQEKRNDNDFIIENQFKLKNTFVIYSNEFTIKEKEADTSKIGSYLALLMKTRKLEEQFSIDIEFSHELQDEESKEIENIFNLTFNRLPDENIAHTSQFYGATADGHTINKLTKISKTVRIVSTEIPVTSAKAT